MEEEDEEEDDERSDPEENYKNVPRLTDKPPFSIDNARMQLPSPTPTA